VGRPVGIHDSINELTLRNKGMKNKCILHIITTKDRLFVGGLVHEHMCETSCSYSWETNVWPQWHSCDQTCWYSWQQELRPETEADISLFKIATLDLTNVP